VHVRMLMGTSLPESLARPIIFLYCHHSRILANSGLACLEIVPFCTRSEIS
jgi:hypothetical protein